MMQIPGLSEQQGHLLKKVGNGLQLHNPQGQLQLSFRQLDAGSGLIIDALSAGKPMRLWLAEDQWCQWIEPMLAVPGFGLTPEDLRDLLAHWTLADAGECQDGSDMAWPEAQSIAPGEAEAGFGWLLSIQRGDRRLDLHLLAGAESWVDSLAASMYPEDIENSAAELTLQASLLAGWSQIDAGTLKKLMPGDALMLQKNWQVSDGQFALFLERPLASLKHDSENHLFYTETIMSDFEDWMDVTPTAEVNPSIEQTLNDARVTVTVEVAQLAVSLQELSRLAPGEVLSGALSHDGLAALKVGNRTIARGTLLQIDSQLAVKISHLC